MVVYHTYIGFICCFCNIFTNISKKPQYIVFVLKFKQQDIVLVFYKIWLLRPNYAYFSAKYGVCNNLLGKTKSGLVARPIGNWRQLNKSLRISDIRLTTGDIAYGGDICLMASYGFI